MPGWIERLIEFIKRLFNWFRQEGENGPVAPNPVEDEGAEGSLPDGWETDKEVAKGVYRQFPPDGLDCNVIAGSFTGTAREDIEACDGYNFRRLYIQAKTDAETQARALECPPAGLDCRHRIIWQLARAAACIPAEPGEAAHAFVHVMVGVGCFNPEDPLLNPEDIGEPSEDSFTDPGDFNRNEQDFERDQPWGPVSRWDDYLREPVQCPGSLRIKFTYYSRVERCDGLDFRPHIDQAKEEARDAWDKMECANDCQKKPFSVVRTEWQCRSVFFDQGGSHHEVHVVIYFAVECANED